MVQQKEKVKNEKNIIEFNSRSNNHKERFDGDKDGKTVLLKFHLSL